MSTTGCECEKEKPGVGMCMCTQQANVPRKGAAICSDCCQNKHKFPDGTTK